MKTFMTFIRSFSSTTKKFENKDLYYLSLVWNIGAKGFTFYVHVLGKLEFCQNFLWKFLSSCDKFYFLLFFIIIWYVCVCVCVGGGGGGGGGGNGWGGASKGAGGEFLQTFN